MGHDDHVSLSMHRMIFVYFCLYQELYVVPFPHRYGISCFQYHLHVTGHLEIFITISDGMSLPYSLPLPTENQIRQAMLERMITSYFVLEMPCTASSSVT